MLFTLCNAKNTIQNLMHILKETLYEINVIRMNFILIQKLFKWTSELCFVCVCDVRSF